MARKYTPLEKPSVAPFVAGGGTRRWGLELTCNTMRQRSRCLPLPDPEGQSQEGTPLLIVILIVVAIVCGLVFIIRH